MVDTGILELYPSLYFPKITLNKYFYKAYFPKQKFKHIGSSKEGVELF